MFKRTRAAREKKPLSLDQKLNRLRWAVLGTAGWFIFAIILPDFFMGIFSYGNRPLNAAFDIASIILLGCSTAYMMHGILRLTRVILPVLIGFLLLAISQICHILGTINRFDNLIPEAWNHFFYHLFQETFNGLGMVLFLCGLFYAIIELLRARHAAETRQRCLEDEMAERRRMEKTVEEQRIQMIAESRLSALGVMASGIAHEINNPLAIIAGGCEQLAAARQNAPNENEIRKKTLLIIQRNVQRIERIIRGLRCLSRDEENDPLSHHAVKPLLTDTLELCQARCQASGIDIYVAEINPNWHIACRPAQFSQVLLNLLNNAFDAIQNTPEKWIRVDAADLGDVFEISVTNSGLPIAPELQEKIFDPFFTTKAPGEGIGLGLSISRRIMESHHGQLLLDAECHSPRFIIRFPKWVEK